MVNAPTEHKEVRETQIFFYPSQAPTFQFGPMPWLLGATDSPKSCQFEQK